MVRGIEGENYVDPCPDMDWFTRHWCMVGKGLENFMNWDGWQIPQPYS